MAKDFKRKYIQLISALIYNANIKGFANGRLYYGPIKGVCVPGLNCYSCPGALASCPLGSLQSAVAVSGKKLPFYIVGTLLLLGVILGRTICGFLCPFGLIQELLHKIPTPKIKKNKATKALSKLKYVILIVFVLALPFAYGYPAFCKYICPAGTLEAGIPMALTNSNIAGIIGKMFAWKTVVLIVIVLICVFIYRGFCRFICPLGAIYGFFNKISVFGVRIDENKCVSCGRCVRECKMDIKNVGDTECISCGECMNSCEFDAIKWKQKKERE